MDAPPNLEHGHSGITQDHLAEDVAWTTRVQNYGGIRDTELVKHYLTHTVRTFAESGICEGQADVWQIFMPAVALDCPVVRQGLLVLAAICLYHDSSADPSGVRRLRYLEAAEAHGKIFVKESRQKFEDFQDGLNMQGQDSILACSRLLCVLGFAFFRTHRNNGTTLADAAAWTWLHLLRGVKTSYLAIIESGRPIDEILLKDMAPRLCCHQPTPRTGRGYQHPCFRYIQQSRREFFDAVTSTLDRDWSSFGDPMAEDLRVAINLLYQVTERICSQRVQNVFRTICTWPAEIPRGFVDMLADVFPPALAVYAHWLMWMILFEDLWLIGDMGRAGILDVIAICSNAEPDVRNLLIWPRHILDVGRSRQTGNATLQKHHRLSHKRGNSEVLIVKPSARKVYADKTCRDR